MGSGFLMISERTCGLLRKRIRTSLCRKESSPEHDAFSEIYRRYQSPGYYLALHISGPQEIAQEVVQEAMLDEWPRAGSFEVHGGNQN